MRSEFSKLISHGSQKFTAHPVKLGIRHNRTGKYDMICERRLLLDMIKKNGVLLTDHAWTNYCPELELALQDFLLHGKYFPQYLQIEFDAVIVKYEKGYTPLKREDDFSVSDPKNIKLLNHKT